MMNGLVIIPFAGFLLLFILISGRILFLKRRGVKMSNNNGNPPGIKYILYPVFLLLFLVWLHELTRPVFAISFSIFSKELIAPLIYSVLLQIFGAFFIFVSVVFMALTLHHFKNSLRFGLNENNQGKLITTGIFSVSRNPFFLSVILYFFGTVLVFPNLFFIGFFVLAVTGIHFFILKEEKFLQKHYDETYRNYKEEVRRYF